MDVFAGSVFVYAAAEQFIQEGLPLCESIDASKYDFTKFNQTMKDIKMDKISPEVIGENLVFNGVTLTNEFVQAMAAFQNKDFKTFGSVIGQTMTTITAHNNNLFLY